jgi:serine/threonine protein kinase
MAQDRFYMAVEKQSFNRNRDFNNFINLDELDTDDYNNFDKLHSLDDHQYRNKIPLYPYDHGNNYNYNYNDSNKNSSYILSSSSASSSINNIAKKSTTGPSKNDIFDTPLTTVRPAPRVSAKEIEELQKQERLREEKHKKEKEKAREEINLKLDKELRDDNTKLYLAWDSFKPMDYNHLFEGSNDLKPDNISLKNKKDYHTSSILHSGTNSEYSSPEGSPSLKGHSPYSYNKKENMNHFHPNYDSKSEISHTTINSNSGSSINSHAGNSSNNNYNSVIKNRLNNTRVELNKLQIKDNNSPTTSPRSSKILSPEEQIARFLNMPFLTSPNKNQNNKSHISPSNSINNFKSAERLKTKSSFYGVSPSFSFSFQMDQESMAKLQKVWNEMYQKFVEIIPNINLSYLPTRKNLIGRGQYSNVYLGLYSVNEDQEDKNKKERERVESTKKKESNQGEEGSQEIHSSYISHEHDTSDDDSPLKQCAVKCFHKDYVSQMVAMTELNILTMLTNQPYIIQLIGIINETEENNVNFHENSTYSTRGSGLATPISNDGKEEDSEPIRVTTILEYASNGNILSWIKKNTEYVGKKLWIKWARQITHAVATFHNMLIIHHDIKPQNILLDDYLNAKIADFGSSCYAPDEFPDRDDLTIENCRFPMDMGLGRGTQAYCAPELFGSSESYTFATDIYSLGVTLIAMMTGNEPFKNTRNNIHMIMCIRKGYFGSGVHDSELRFLNGEIAEPKIVDLLSRCVDIDPLKRPTAEKMLEELMEIDDYVPLEEKL